MPSQRASSPDPELVARLARLGVSLGTAGLPGPERSGGTPQQGDAADSAPPLGAGAAGRDRPARFDPADRAAPWDAPASEAGWEASLDAAPIEGVLAGAVAANAHGRCFVHAHARAADESYGGAALGEALTASTRSLAELTGRAALADVDMARAAFVDTETTGLSGGAGTYAFLVGVGRFVDDRFEVRQFFMRDPGEERAQLAEVADWVGGCTAVVTFNGRAFDLPLLASRYAFHRALPPFPDDRHLDLLHPARRLWRRRLVSCALQSLERHILGLEREGDVPGWLIPGRYLDYQRTGDARPLAPVFEHNQLDILSMVGLVTHLARAYGEPAAALAHGEDWLSLARTYAARGDWRRVIDACGDALATGLAGADADEAQYHLAMAAKRLGEWDRAVAVWTAQVAVHPPRRLYPFEELAKYWEHRAPEADPARALAYAERARGLVAGGQVRPRRGRATALVDLDHRVARLRRKAGRLR